MILLGSRGGAVALMMGLVLCSLICEPGIAQNPPDRDRIASALSQGSSEERITAVSAILQIPAAQRGPTIRAAVVLELARYQRELEVRAAAIRAGETIAPREDHGAYLADLLEILIDYDDPDIIDPLIPFIGTGNRVMNVLAQFGGSALEGVASVAASLESSSRDASAALTTLERMLTQPVRQPLTEQSKQRVASVAAQRLIGTQDPIVLWSAISLAVSTGDADLRARVQQIADDPDAIRDLGITQPNLIEYVQQRARSVLAARMARTRTASFYDTSVNPRARHASGRHAWRGARARARRSRRQRS